ncbi:MAG: phytanoyl-CoA dioxygenase family protein [Armatimonadetes bacterium]|nr:phytanoyl-CoA dioxygenase family protein [Armatimonadota bacterium]
MRVDVTQKDIDSYQENGFIVWDGFLDQDELEVWRAAVDEAVEGRKTSRLPGERWQGEAEGYYGKVFKQRINLWMDNPRMKELMLDERIGKMAADLAGVEGMRVWHDQALIKGPWANPTAWHLDTPYWSFSSRDAISIWIALDDATLENGCLFFIPGSHRITRFDNVGIGEEIGALFQVYPELAGMKAVAAPMKAGSCSFHNGLTAHGAHANMTPGLRRAMTCAFMPDGSTFNGQSNVLPERILEKIKVGDLLNDPEQNPLVFSR